MYFTNINNDELKHFKDTKIPFNFSISLTGILTDNHPLFHVEDIGNNIYRICPLFKCKEILSTNEEDKLFDTSCIITIQKTKETYYLFKNNEDDDTYSYSNTGPQVYEHYFPNFSINDDLNDADFNRIVYLLRKNRKHYDNIQIKHDTLINSTYSSYLFDLKDSTISDEGIIITPKTLENDCTVTLINPVFHNSKYYLNLTVKSINNINLCTGDDYPITTDTIRIPLTKNTPVTIPFEDIELYNIISFEASVEIIHSEPVFIEESYLNLSASTNHIDIGGSVTLTATYYNSSGSSADKTIIFKDNGIQIGQAITNNQGIATLTYTPDTVKSYSISADYENTIISNTVNVNVTKLTPTLLLEANTDSAFSGMSITVEGSLKYHNTVLSNESVKIYDGSTFLTTLTTDSSGEFDTTITATSSDMSLKAVFDGDNTYANVESDSISILNVSDYMEIVWNGTTLRQSPYANNPLINSSNHDVIIDYGDGTVEISHNYGHTYSNSGDHTIKIYNITSIGYAAFSSRTGLTNVTIPNTVTNIESNAFTGCTDLSNITIPDTVTNIGSVAFYRCTGLTNVTIPDSVTSIESSVFSDCTGLSSIVLEWDSSASIISYNFSWIHNCTSFNHFLIPEGTTSLYTAEGYPSNLLKEKISYDGMSLSKTAGKDILSYADVTAQGNTEYAVVTAQLTNNGSSVSASGVPVVFGAYLNDVLISGTEQTVDTDSNGQASYTYTSAGMGDIVVKVVPDQRSSLIQTYTIQDCLIHDNMTSDSGHYTGSPSNKSYSNNGMTINNSNWTAWKYNESLSQGTSIEFDITALTGSEWNMYMPFYDSSNTEIGAFNAVLNRVNFLGTTENVSSALGNWKIEIKENTLKAYLNDVLTVTTTFTTQSFTIGWLTGGSRSFTIKNLKIKPL